MNPPTRDLKFGVFFVISYFSILGFVFRFPARTWPGVKSSISFAVGLRTRRFGVIKEVFQLGNDGKSRTGLQREGIVNKDEPLPWGSERLFQLKTHITAYFPGRLLSRASKASRESIFPVLVDFCLKTGRLAG